MTLTAKPPRLLQLPDIVIIACRQLDTTPEELRERCLDAHNRVVVIKGVIVALPVVAHGEWAARVHRVLRRVLRVRGICRSDRRR